MLDHVGGALGTASFPTTTTGYTELLNWLEGHGAVAQAGVEGTGRYGVGLTQYLRTCGVSVVEVSRPNRQVRRRHGKGDVVDQGVHESQRMVTIAWPAYHLASSSTPASVAATHPELSIVAGRPAWPWQAAMIAVMLHKHAVWSELHGWSPKYLDPALLHEIPRRLSKRTMFGSDYRCSRTKVWWRTGRAWG